MSTEKGCWADQDLDLSQLTFSAKCDYVSFHTTRKETLPSLDGKAVWPRGLNGRRLSIHDVTSNDIAALVAHGHDFELSELEVAIDVRTRHGSQEERIATLQRVMVDLFARKLFPQRADHIQREFRAFYRPLGSHGVVRPFNMTLPSPLDQQLHGGRNDRAQVKAYFKSHDQRRRLSPDKYSARVEVRLSGEGLTNLGLNVASDLLAFKFRKHLTPYFRFVGGVEQKGRASVSGMRQVLRQAHSRIDNSYWDRNGVGAFLPGSNRLSYEVRFRRDTAVNGRIGQALLRLERQFASQKFVCPAVDASAQVVVSQ